jgi:hypothetical protein
MMATFSTAAVLVVRSIANTVIKLKQGSGSHQVGASPMSEDRMARLEASVEAIAIEVERISEGQRFTTKLLSENSHQPPTARIAPHRVESPH